MKRTDPGFFLELATAAARSTLPRFRNIETIDNKSTSDFDPVTIADREAEAEIRKIIRFRFPDDSIIGEEMESHSGDSRYCWVLDPIDGTRAFLTGIPLWGTLVGLLEDNRPIAGMMSQPYVNEIFFGIEGACYLQRGKTTQAICTSSQQVLDNALLMTTAPELFTNEENKGFREIADLVRMTRYGADCYAYCMLAAGQVDLVIEAGLNLYDIAALIPIIQNAGGVVSGWRGEAFGASRRIVAAATPRLHADALRILSKV